MGTKGRRSFSREYKVEALRMIEEQGLSATARALGVGTGLLTKWRAAHRQEGKDAFRGKGNRTALEEENRRLRLENQQLRMEQEILKKASAYFARNQK